MRLHHLNCISSCPLGGWLMDARSPSAFQRGRLCCHCLLAETDRGLVLVDTGFGLQDVGPCRGAAHVDGDVQLICAHDATEFERVAGRPIAAPASRLQGP